MRSTSAPSEDLPTSTSTTPAIWYDGINALSHEGEAWWHRPDVLVLTEDTELKAEIPISDLLFVDARTNWRTFKLRSQPDFRLRLPRDLPPEVADTLPRPETYGRLIDRIGLARAAITLGVTSAAIAALFLTAPQWLGPMIPLSWEQRIGDAMVGDLGNRLCATPAAEAALAKLTATIDPSGQPVQVGIANIRIVNAVALPGSRVLLFDGIVQQAESPEELAGVLAHEIGHVRERHIMSALLRQFGLTMILAGGNSSVMNSAFGVASLGYSRSAEREADTAARQALAQANISPLGAAEFFERVAGDDRRQIGAANSETEGQASGAEPAKEISNWLASHPSSRERATEYRAAAKANHAYRTPLTPQEFAALKTACNDDADVESFDLF